MYTTDAIVLKAIPTGEADEIVSLYTKDYGKLSMKAKSSKKITTKQGQFLHEPSILRCSFVLSRAGHILSGINNIKGYNNVAQDIMARGYILSFFSICDKVTYEGQKDERIWNLLVSAMEDASGVIGDTNKEKELWKMEKLWLMSFLQILGYKMNNYELHNIKDSSQLDFSIKNILQNRLEQEIEFFGLKTKPEFV
ncbi:MAG: DNA repair protein RecO [Candidatus Spechtbacterales bacterium]